MIPFKCGDKVQWTSQAAGHMKTKVGTIFLLVPAETLPMELLRFSDPALEGYNMGSLFNTRMPRNHTSWLVSVLAKGKGKPTLYWPRAWQLEAVTGGVIQQ